MGDYRRPNSGYHTGCYHLNPGCVFITHTRSHPQPHVLYMNYDPTKKGCGTPPLVLALSSEVGTMVPENICCNLAVWSLTLWTSRLFLSFWFFRSAMSPVNEDIRPIHKQARSSQADGEPHIFSRKIQLAHTTHTPDLRRVGKIKILSQCLFGASHKRFILALLLFP